MGLNDAYALKDGSMDFVRSTLGETVVVGNKEGRTDSVGVVLGTIDGTLVEVGALDGRLDGFVRWTLCWEFRLIFSVKI